MKSELNRGESKACFKKDYSEFFKDIEVNRKCDCDDFSPEFQARIPEVNHKRDYDAEFVKDEDSNIT